MDNMERLKAFFEAENSRDWEKYRRFLHHDVKWTLHSDEEHTICGIDDYLAVISGAYKGNSNTFVCEAAYQSEDGERIAAILKNSMGRRSCDIFEFDDGLICEEHEFIL